MPTRCFVSFSAAALLLGVQGAPLKLHLGIVLPRVTRGVASEAAAPAGADWLVTLLYLMVTRDVAYGSAFGVADGCGARAATRGFLPEPS